MSIYFMCKSFIVKAFWGRFWAQNFMKSIRILDYWKLHSPISSEEGKQDDAC